MSEEQREAFDKAWADLKAAIVQEALFKQIYRFVKWLLNKIYTAFH